MAENAFRSKDGRHPAPLSRQQGVTNGVYAPVDDVKTPALDAVADRAASESMRHQLLPCHDALLAFG